jgi:hypothetical protein
MRKVEVDFISGSIICMYSVQSSFFPRTRYVIPSNIMTAAGRRAIDFGQKLRLANNKAEFGLQECTQPNLLAKALINSRSRTGFVLLPWDIF